MKRLWVFITACLLLFSSAAAETVTTQEFTADEQAYNVYLDISTGYAEGVKYLEEIEYLWRQAIELGDVEKADSVWFNAMIATSYAGDSNVERFARLQDLAQLKYGFGFSGLYNYFEALLKLQKSDEVFNIVRAAITLSLESGYVQSAESLEKYLDDAKAGIRTLMKLDPDYSFTEDLQNYYKELNLLLKYIQDFNATYTDFKAKTENFAEKLISYEVDFEFIFDLDDFSKVLEVRSAKQTASNEAVYNEALLLENNMEYSAAIDMYWQCRNHSDSLERMTTCQNAIKEEKYQVAVEYENKGDYPAAVILYEELADYKDSNVRKLHCGNYIGYVTISGRYVTEALGGFSNGVAAVKKNEKWGYINTDGDVVIPFEYDSALTFSEGLAAVEKNGKWGYIDINNNAVIPLEYIYATSMVDGSAVVWKARDKNNNVSDAGYITQEGIYTKTEGIPQSYSRIISDGLRTYKGSSYGSAWGYENQNGEVVIPCQFGYAYDFSDGMGCVCDGDTFFATTRYGFVNTEGEIVIPYQYESALDFHEGYAPVMKNGKWGLINKLGEVVLPIEHDAVTVCREGYFISLDEGVIHIHAIDEL